jgi:hypothetical protein
LPSTQVGKKATTEREVAMALAESRQTEPKRLVTQLRGDLDWITLKALEKDRSRRYGTASELASDIQRYLNSEPVLARPASVGYLLRKYVRRHRAGVAAAFILIALLISSTVLELVQLQQTRRERDRATRERDRATRVTDFMTNMFNVADPSESRGYATRDGVTQRYDVYGGAPERARARWYGSPLALWAGPPRREELDPTSSRANPPRRKPTSVASIGSRTLG